MEKKQAIELLKRYREGTATLQERLLVQQVYLEHYGEALPPELPIDIEAMKDDTFSVLQEKDKRLRKPIHKSIYPNTKLRIAAAVLFGLFAFGGAAYWTKSKNPSFFGPAPITQADIPPGGNRAILTLANGERIELDGVKTGNIVQAAGATIKKTAESIEYTANNGKSNETSKETNQIYTPKGGQYKLVLEDGTKVWLNAGSTLTYPVSFNGREARTVTLTGEAYFQVAKNPKKPFIVNSLGKENSIVQQIRVTGTHFNVNCVNDEKIETTLAEGSVLVNNIRTHKTLALSPGQQSTIDSKGTQVKQVNPKDYISWKDGLFSFNQTPLSRALRQIGNWYDCEVDTRNIPNILIDGEIPRNVRLSQVLAMLEKISDTKLTVEERRIMIK